MKTRVQWQLLAIALFVGASFGAALAEADDGIQDHLKCYHIKLPRGFKFDKRTVDLVDQFGLEPGCTVEKPLELCVPAEKFPSGPPFGIPVGHFIRYKIKCPKFEDRNVQAIDQFLNEIVTLTEEKTLMVPAEKDLCCGVFDRCIDADGTATAGDGIPGAVEVATGDPLVSFPVGFPPVNDSGLDMFDNDGDVAWTFGPGGDDLHVEGKAFCSTGIRDSVHEPGADCVVLDLDGSLFNGQVVNCDLETGGSCTPPLPAPITYHDTNGNSVWDDGEDIVLDGNGNGICD